MDTSPSTAGKLKFEQESAMNFIQTVVRARKDQVLFATFDHEINLRQDFTGKLDLLDLSALKSLQGLEALEHADEIYVGDRYGTFEVGVTDLDTQALFVENVRDRVVQGGCHIDRADIPNDPENTVKEVRDAVSRAAH